MPQYSWPMGVGPFAALNPHYWLGFEAFSEHAARDRVDFFERTAPDTWSGVAAAQWRGYAEGVGLPILLAALGGIALGIARAPRITFAWLALIADATSGQSSLVELSMPR